MTEKQYQLTILDLQIEKLALQINLLQMQGQAAVKEREKLAAEVEAEQKSADATKEE